ncbi:hypothetical protein ES703_01736 [subsurface metagenome]
MTAFLALRLERSDLLPENWSRYNVSLRARKGV